MERLELLLFIQTLFVVINLAYSQDEDAPRGNFSRHRFSFKRNLDKVAIGDSFQPFMPTYSERNFNYKVPENTFSVVKKNASNNVRKPTIRRYDEANLDIVAYKPLAKLGNFWMDPPYENITSRKDSIKKYDHTWPTWGSKKEIYHNNKSKKNRKYMDSVEDYLGLDSKYHEMADRKYIHEHEGFFFPIHVPSSSSSHHDRDDHLIPLLLLLLLPLLLFAIIIPLNANLLSTLFLIMQNNGASSTAAQLAAAGRRKRRNIYNRPHPIVEERVMETLHKISAITEF